MYDNTMAEHLRKEQYGDFWLTDAIRPGLDMQIVPRQGFRIETYQDTDAGFRVPVLAAAVSREKLFEVFIDLLDPLGDVVDVVLESSHDTDGSRHFDMVRQGIDLPILKSHCYECEDLLLNDGCTGLAVLSTSQALEVQFDEHKLLVVYAANLKPFITVLKEHGIPYDPKLRLLTEAEHLHSTDPRHLREFERLSYLLGVGEPAFSR